MNTLSNISVTQKIMAVLGVFVFILVVFSFYLTQRQNQSATSVTAIQTKMDSQAISEVKAKTDIIPRVVPQVHVSKWTEGSAPSKAVNSAYIYNFQRTFPLSFVQNLSNKFEGIVRLYQVGEQQIALSWRRIDDIATFSFNSKTGVFSYASTKGSVIPNTSAIASAIEKATVLVNSLIFDPTVKYSATYKRTDKPGVTFVEFHRNWNAVGLPILNAYGIFNLPDNKLLSNLTFLSGDNRSSDDNIFETSDRKDGMKRSNDFNTITVAVLDNEPKVLSVESNIRFLTGTPSEVSVLKYEDALSALKSNNYEFLYTSPEGEGVPRFDLVYPGNSAVLTNAFITETIVSYIENPPQTPQDRLEPYYIFKGKGMLASGYSVEFIAGVPSSAPTGVQSFIDSAFRFIHVEAQIYDVEDTGQKQGTFDAAPTLLPTTPPTVVPTIKQVFQADSNAQCDPDVSALTNITIFSPEFSIGQLSETYTGNDKARIGNWYVISMSSTGSLTAEALLEQIKIIQQAKLGGIVEEETNDFRDLSDLVEDIIHKLGTTCPIRISGESPTIFTYGPIGETISVSPLSAVTFSNPPLKDGWNVTMGKYSPDYLYYEYKPVAFNRPEKGWNVSRNELSKFASVVSKKLGLSSAEKSRLIFELNHAATDVEGNNLFIGVIPQSEVDAKLPLASSVAATRVHFFVGNANGPVNAPVVSPIHRTNSMILEIGASSATEL